MSNSTYRWVIVAAGGLLGCVAIGAMFSLPVFLLPISKSTGWSVTSVSLIWFRHGDREHGKDSHRLDRPVPWCRSVPFSWRVSPWRVEPVTHSVQILRADTGGERRDLRA